MNLYELEAFVSAFSSKAYMRTNRSLDKAGSTGSIEHRVKLALINESKSNNQNRDKSLRLKIMTT
jgi:hypothetical protein